MKPKGKRRKSSPGQMKLPWDEWEATKPEIARVAERFVFANCYWSVNFQLTGKGEGVKDKGQLLALNDNSSFLS